MKSGRLLCIIMLLIACPRGGKSQPESAQSATEVERKIEQLKSQLRWSDEASYNQYAGNRVRVTNQVWALVDSFVSQAYNPPSVSAEQMRSAIDLIPDHKSGDIENTVVFPVDIPAGKFLIAGLEVTRGGGAIAEDAISFRAYGQQDGRWKLVSHTELESADDFLSDLHALALPGGFPGKFGFIAWADVPPLTPYKELTVVYAFDGQKFTTVLAPQTFIVATDVTFVTLTSTGFDLNTLTADRKNGVLRSYIVAGGDVIKSTEVDLGPR